MATQKIIKVGNSHGVIIPTEIMDETHLKIGDEVEVEMFPNKFTITIRSTKAPYKTTITPEFKQWLDEFVERNKILLKTLAKTP